MSTNPHGNSTGRKGGFTLLELILVLALIGTALSIASPSLSGFARGRDVADAASRVLAMTQLARSQSAAEGRPFRIHLDEEDNSIWLGALKGFDYEEWENDFCRGFDIPETLSVTLWTPQSVNHVQFEPDGMGTEAQFEITGLKGNTYRVICESPNERFYIEGPDGRSAS